jgi:F0F1-type ATP synthase assembly protein I
MLWEKHRGLRRNPVVRWALKAYLMTFLFIIVGGVIGVVVAKIFNCTPLAFFIVTISLGLALIYMLVDFQKAKKGGNTNGS